MRQAHVAFSKRFSKALKAEYDAIANEPMPQRWVDLIYDLNEKEEEQAQPPAAPHSTAAPTPTMNSRRKRVRDGM